MNNEPVAWIKQGRLGYPVLEFDKPFRYESYAIQNQPIPLYTHPHPDNLGLALSIIDQQKLEIKRLKTIIEEYKIRPRGKSDFAKAILRKANEK